MKKWHWIDNKRVGAGEPYCYVNDLGQSLAIYDVGDGTFNWAVSSQASQFTWVKVTGRVAGVDCAKAEAEKWANASVQMIVAEGIE